MCVCQNSPVALMFNLPLLIEEDQVSPPTIHIPNLPPGELSPFCQFCLPTASLALERLLVRLHSLTQLRSARPFVVTTLNVKVSNGLL